MIIIKYIRYKCYTIIYYIIINLYYYYQFLLCNLKLFVSEIINNNFIKFIINKFNKINVEIRELFKFLYNNIYL